MIIKSLKLENIRSYKEASIELPLGKTLFEGDIGSGKSTLLMGIEFSLFGLGSETGGALLKAGEKEGKVELVFEVDGSEYSVVRRLVRKGVKVQQAEGTLGTREGASHLSPSELKERILNILGFNEPSDPKSQSVIYRYAVYTPQEEMKSIIFMRPDLRLQTLRRAFRIEDYKTANQNAAELSRRLGSRAENFEAMATDVQLIKERILHERSQIELEMKRLSALRTEAEEKEKHLKSLNEEREKLRSDEQKLLTTLREISLLEKMAKSSKDESESLRGDVESLEKRIARSQSQAKEIKSVADPTPKTAEQLKNEVSGLESHAEELKKLQARLESKIEDYETVQRTGSCPTCDREADPAIFVQKISVKGIEKDEVATKIAQHMINLEEAKSLLEKKQQYEVAQQRLGELQEDILEYNRELGQKTKKVDEARIRYEETDRKLKESRDSAELLKGISADIKRLDPKLKVAEDGLRVTRDDVAAASTTVKEIRARLKERGGELRKKQDYAKRAEVLKEYQIWTDDYFISTLEMIERHVLMNINQEFNTNFQDWFSKLVDDAGKEARVDENFTPILEQDGYEQEIYYLSGGEKTSLALAYRLALNNVVQKVATGMKTNLVIFDEPTDGFSKEQLGKVREILDELQSPQVIVVSHEKELESFADQIFRIVKVNGESSVLSGR